MKNPIQELHRAIALVQDPYTHKSLADADFIKELKYQAGKVSLVIYLYYPGNFVREMLEHALRERLMALDFVQQLKVSVQHIIRAKRPQNGIKKLPNIKNIIAVASGKGGVGKSTVAANLAVSLAAAGAKTGLLDADIHGPSQTKLFSVQHHGKAALKDEKYLLPMTVFGVEIMSIALIAPENTPLIWRGPMVTNALKQMLFYTVWDMLDYLIIDMPPGTGDIQLTLSQKIPVTGAVIVTTPQDVALLDVRKSIQAFHKLHVPVIGIVENMSYHICEQCQHKSFILGQGGGEQLVKEFKTDMLGKLPLSSDIYASGEAGIPMTSAIYPAKKSAAHLTTAAQKYHHKDLIAMYQDIAIKTALNTARLDNAEEQIIDVVHQD